SRHPRDRSVIESVQRDLVAFGDHRPHKSGIPAGAREEHEERGVSAEPGEDLQNLVRAPRLRPVIVSQYELAGTGVDGDYRTERTPQRPHPGSGANWDDAAYGVHDAAGSAALRAYAAYDRPALAEIIPHPRRSMRSPRAR